MRSKLLRSRICLNDRGLYQRSEKQAEENICSSCFPGTKLFNEAQLKFSIYYKEFLGLYFALEHFSHFIWVTEKPVIVTTKF